MVLKCKMCGGELALTDSSSLAECQYCGSVQTVPNVSDDKMLTLFSRANRLRFNCEFDKAYSVYESIVSEFPEEAEAYWGLVLCKYGVEYVDDPSSGRKIPTCHRSSFESILDDDNFEQALENADPEAKKVYRMEAKAIEELRKSIIEVSSNEEPYDIFICYKETDAKGNRTLDSVIAQDIYDALVEKNYRVFFARITLEDKLGQEYEPYIFSALNSARVMLVIGTDYDHFDAVWVKNEWSRYLKLVSTDSKKHLIPCYKGIDAYDMPKEFAKLQAQDLGKVGAVQDLLRGIDKLIAVKDKEKPASSGGADIIADTLKKAYTFLNEEDWASAKKCLDTVLGYDPQNADALIGCLMQSLNVPQEKKLADCKSILGKEDLYKQAIKFADEKTKKRLEEYNRSTIYNFAMAQSKIPGSVTLALAIRHLESISGWGDADEQIKLLRQKQNKAKKTRIRIITSVAAVIAVIVMVYGFLVFKSSYLEPLGVYKEAVALMEQGSLQEAADKFTEVEDFKDSREQHNRCLYLKAQGLMDAGNYKEALGIFNGLGSYMDSAEKATELGKEIAYGQGIAAFKSATSEKQLRSVISILEPVSDYKDAQKYIYEAEYKIGDIEYAAKQYSKAIEIFVGLKEDGHSAGAKRLEEIEKAIYAEAKKEYNATNWGTAKELFEKLVKTGYSDSKNMAAKCAENIKNERSAYNGVWREAEDFWTDLMIDDSGVHYAADEADQQRGNWTKVGSYTYDEDTGVMTFDYWTDDEYEVVVSGNTLTLKWTNQQDQWDTDWFSTHNVFYRD